VRVFGLSNCWIAFNRNHSGTHNPNEAECSFHPSSFVKIVEPRGSQWVIIIPMVRHSFWFVEYRARWFQCSHCFFPLLITCISRLGCLEHKIWTEPSSLLLNNINCMSRDKPYSNSVTFFRVRGREITNGPRAIGLGLHTPSICVPTLKIKVNLHSMLLLCVLFTIIRFAYPPPDTEYVIILTRRVLPLMSTSRYLIFWAYFRAVSAELGTICVPTTHIRSVGARMAHALGQCWESL